MKGLHFIRKVRLDKPVLHYFYAWRGGPLIARREGGGKPKLTPTELKAAIQFIEGNEAPETTSLKSLIRDWEESPEWNNLARNTQKTWGSQVKKIEERWGQTPLTVWNDIRMKARVVVWRDSRAETPRGADIGVTVLRELLKFGMLRGKVLLNVADGIPRLYHGGNREEIIWTNEDINQFTREANHQNKLPVLDGLRLCALTGLRRADLVSVTRDEVFEHAIIKRAQKESKGRRRTASMPRVPELDELLAELDTRYRADGVNTLLVNSFGKPWTGDGFGGSFNRIRDAAKITHTDPDTGEKRLKHLHDVRGTFATRLIDNGLPDADVAEVMAWSVEKVSRIRRIYVDQSCRIMAIGKQIRRSAVN